MLDTYTQELNWLFDAKKIIVCPVELRGKERMASPLNQTLPVLCLNWLEWNSHFSQD
jgi:hypothetical protein